MADAAAWSAPRSRAPLAGTVTVPGSKSLSNRYLVLAALATGQSRLDGLLHSRDTELMARALQDLGARVEEDGGSTLVSSIRPRAGDAHSFTTADRPVHVDCGLAGTVMRFVPPVAAALGIPAVFDGDPAARKRPMGTVLDALAQLGAAVDAPTGGLPFTVNAAPAASAPAPDRPCTVAIDASASSQFVSGLLLAGCALPGGLHVEHTGATLPSRPHIDMTLEVLRDVGVTVDHPTPETWTVAGGRPDGFTARIEPDLSNAATFLAAALVTGGTVSVPHWPRHTTQAGDAFRAIVDSFGGRVRLDADGLTVNGPRVLTPVDLDLSQVGELTPVIAAVAACADGVSRLRGIGHLRGHETDRLAALAAELTRMGATVDESPDTLTITAPATHGGLWHTYADHRMVMAGAVLALRIAGVKIADPATVGKTLPTFTCLWENLVCGPDE